MESKIIVFTIVCLGTLACMWRRRAVLHLAEALQRACAKDYSNRQWASRCISESFSILVTGLQAALGQLGKSPLNLGTGNTSAATHELEQMPVVPTGITSITWNYGRTML